MKQTTLRLDDDLHAKVMEKVERELRTFNAVVIRLLEKWLAQEVNLEPPQVQVKETD